MLDHADAHHVLAADGWLGLGNPVEAAAELAQVSQEALELPEVLEVRWAVTAGLKNWEEALEIARTLLGKAPDRPTGWLHRAYALRRVPGGSVQQAQDALLPAFERFPSESVIPYNLSCYACQLGDLDSARTWLRRAISSAGLEAIRDMALEDPDLARLHEEIRRMKS